jgi:DNA (cytosine-5)-methyltransferase 1
MSEQKQPRGLDLFCKQGGVSKGLVDAGFDITGIDIKPQPLYPFNFIQGDALTISLDGYDFYWASPPCQSFSKLKGLSSDKYPNLIELIRARLIQTGKPFVIENVVGSPLINPIMLCGTMFGLKVKRHRLFECKPAIYPLLPSCACKGKMGFTHAYKGISSFKHGAKLICVVGHNFHVSEAREAMGIDWMNREGLREAIPPIMAKFIGQEMRKYV